MLRVRDLGFSSERNHFSLDDLGISQSDRAATVDRSNIKQGKDCFLGHGYAVVARKGMKY